MTDDTASKPSDDRMSRSRVQARLQQELLQGGGSAYPANYQSMGKTKEEAEELANQARELAEKGFVSKEEFEAEERAKEFEPPDLRPASDEEKNRASQLMALMRGAKGLSENPRERFQRDLDVLREKIEATLDPIDPVQLIFDGYARQEIPLLQGKVLATYQSLRSEEYALIERWIMTADELRDQPPVLKTKTQVYATCAMALKALNDEHGPEVPDWSKNGGLAMGRADFQSIVGSSIMRRLRWLMERPAAVVDLLTANYTWFEQRLHRIVTDTNYLTEKIKKP